VPGHRLIALVAALAAVTASAEPRSLDEVPPEGVWLSSGLEAAWLAGDGHLGLSVGLGVETGDLRAHLRAPVYLRVLDVPPAQGGEGACAIVRCADWLGEDGELDARRLSRIIDLIEGGDPERDPLYLRLGPIFATLGRGAVVDRYLNSPNWDERQSGLYAHINLEEELGARADLLLGGLFAPDALSAARLELRPAAWTEGTPLMRRLGVGLTWAGDFSSQTISALALDARWAIFSPESPVQVEPRLVASGLYGLGLGVGAHAGLQLSLRFPWVAVRADGRFGVDSPGHRTGLFSTLYEIERDRALAGAAELDGGIATVPAPGGLTGAGLLELRVADVAGLGARVHLEQAPGAGVLELFTDVAAGPVRVAARLVSRDLVAGPDPRRIWAVGDASYRVWGPFTAYVRYARSFRELARTRPFDDDVWVGVNASAVLE
jgi:hypothetical protein